MMDFDAGLDPQHLQHGTDDGMADLAALGNALDLRPDEAALMLKRAAGSGS